MVELTQRLQLNVDPMANLDASTVEVNKEDQSLHSRIVDTVIFLSRFKS